jgi:hypothetical protein
VIANQPVGRRLERHHRRLSAVHPDLMNRQQFASAGKLTSIAHGLALIGRVSDIADWIAPEET